MESFGFSLPKVINNSRSAAGDLKHCAMMLSCKDAQ